MRHFWAILFGVVLAGAFVLTAVSPWMNWWIPRSASSYSGDIDRLFYVILAVIGFFYVLTESILVYNMMKFAGEPGKKAQFTHGNHKLEMLWTVVPAVILLLLAVYQISAWADIKYPTRLADKIQAGEDYLLMEVGTRQWDFRVRYPSPDRIARWSDKEVAKKDFTERLPPQREDVTIPNDVHTWKGQKVVVFLKTRDVGHSFFVPALRVKQDALPGRTIPLWFEPTEANTKRVGDAWEDGHRDGGEKDDRYVWDLVCTQYCGTRHSLMRGKLYVHPTKDDFLAWLKAAQADSGRTQPEKAAEKVARAE